MTTLVPQLKALIARYYVIKEDYSITFEIEKPNALPTIKLKYNYDDIKGQIVFKSNMSQMEHNMITLKRIKDGSTKYPGYMQVHIYSGSHFNEVYIAWDDKQFYFNHCNCIGYIPNFLTPIILTILDVINFIETNNFNWHEQYIERVNQFASLLVNNKIK
jgi:hypothetical protein